MVPVQGRLHPQRTEHDTMQLWSVEWTHAALWTRLLPISRIHSRWKGNFFLHFGRLFSWYWTTFSSLWVTFFLILGDFFFTLGDFLLKPSGHPYLCQDILTKLLLTPDCSPVHRRLLEWGRFKPWLRPNYFLLHSSDWMLLTCMLLAGVCQWALVTPLKAMRVGMGFLKKPTELFQWNQTKSQSMWPELSKFCRWASFWRVYLVFGKFFILL